MSMMRDENGNIREGVKWYIELNDILVDFFGNECGWNRGFYSVDGKMADVFELDITKKPTEEFFKFIKEYKSEHIKGIRYSKSIKNSSTNIELFRNAVVVFV